MNVVNKHVPNLSPIPLEEAQQLVFSTIRALPIIHIPLSQAYGYCLAETVKADHDVPMFERSMVDGYALRAEDVASASGSDPVKLQVIEEIPAGHMPRKKIAQGTSSRIMTGAPIPTGANAVIKVEETEAEDGGTTVLIYESIPVGGAISPKGQDMEEGNVVLKPGTLLGPIEVALLATFGVAIVPVYAKPTVGILSTGSELLNVDEPMLPGKLRDSNGVMLAGLISQAGGSPVHFGLVPDVPEVLEKRMIEILQQVDILVTSGGVSMGEYDYLGRAFEKIGAKVVFWKTLIRPGMPVLYGTWKDKPIFSLAGNPASSYVNAWLYLLPAIRFMSGSEDLFPPRIKALCDEKIEKMDMPHTRYLRGLSYVSSSGELRLKISKKQSSNVLSSFLESNCLVRVPGNEGFNEGELIEVELLRAIKQEE